MLIKTGTQNLASTSLLKASPSPGLTSSGPRDTFIASEPTPAPVWKKAVNSGVMGVAGSVVGTTVATVILASTISGPDALAAPLLGAAVGAPVGLALGTVMGWKAVSAQRPGVGKKLLNAAGWGIAGAGVGAALTVATLATGSGSAALGAVMFAPAGATVGAVAGAALGWHTLKS